MIKKLVAATAFAGAMTAGVPAAHATSYGECVAKLQVATMSCGGYAPCLSSAEADFLKCLEELYDSKDPIDPN